MDITSYLKAIPSAFSAGATLYLTAFMLGLGVSMGWILNPSPTAQFFGYWWVMGLVFMLYVVENVIVAIPVADVVIRVSGRVAIVPRRA